MLASDRYDSLIQYYAEKHGLDWKVLHAQVNAESGFDPNAVSSSGAEGLAQFMPATLSELAVNNGWGPVQPFNPEYNLRAQAVYMGHLVAQFGNVRTAVAAYNAGPGRVGRLIQTFGKAWEMHLPDVTHKYLIKIFGV